MKFNNKDTGVDRIVNGLREGGVVARTKPLPKLVLISSISSLVFLYFGIVEVSKLEVFAAF